VSAQHARAQQAQLTHTRRAWRAPQIDESERDSTAQRLSKDLDRERVARTPAEMAAEAAQLRAVCSGATPP
jgi:hypothetical protein